MAALPNGHYRTAAGSQMWISGDHGGRSVVEFDWVEEGACCDCQAQPYEVDGMLTWHCDECDGGCAQLYPADSLIRGPLPIRAIPTRATSSSAESGPSTPACRVTTRALPGDCGDSDALQEAPRYDDHQ